MAKKKRVDTLEIPLTLIQAVREKYSRDPTSPGVILSEVDAAGVIYASVVRYHAKWAQQKEVVASVKAKTLREAVRGLSARWLQVGKAGDRLQRMVDPRDWME
jgi:hypothetical protein